MVNPFDPLKKNEKAQNKFPKSSKDEGVALVPVPDDVTRKTPEHYQLGQPLRFWEYKDDKGRTLHFMCRFIDKDGDKHDRPLTYRQYQDGSRRWAYKGLDAPRPLYGLDRLANAPKAPVIVCEGEKATDAATALFPDHVAVTSPNGAGSPHKANWQPLKDCDVTIWPDHDDEGRKYAQSVARLVKQAGAKSVRIVTVPDDFSDKWDLADELPEGRTQSDLEILLDEAQAIIDPLENLVERAKDNPGIAYRQDVMDALSTLKREDMPAFINLRAKLKKAGVGVTQLDSAMLQRCSETGEVSPEPDHLELAREVIDHIGSENLLGTVAHVWRWYDSGVWRPVPDRAIKQDVQRSLETNSRQVFRGTVDAIADVLKTETHAAEHKWDLKRDAVNVLNGELHWSGTEWELQPHCRENFRTTQIPVVYDQQADCPRFTKFLTEIFQGDKDGQEKALAIAEMIGYTLVSHARFERFALLIGSGSNGKSVVMEVVRALVGPENVAAVQPSQFGNKFQRAHLHLKLANLVTEIAEGGEIADAELKAITSGELTTAEHKNKDPFDFCPFCTCWFGANHMPHTRDFSDALFRRALVLPFNRKFEGTNADKNLKTTLLDELPGIMNLALQAFGEVLKRGTFTEPQSCLTAKQEWRLEADQAAQFIGEKCIIDSEAAIESGALYTEYKLWADDAGISRKLNHKNFTRRIERLGAKAHKGTGGKRMIAGIRLASLRDREEMA
jgi:putative DNA primase/helicase